MKNDPIPCPCQDKVISTTSTTGNLFSPAPRVPVVQDCTCIPYSLLCCCGPQNGISVIQPSCQTLSNGNVVNNPSYDPETGLSYWTYKFMTDCSSSTRAISNFGIPICENIIATNITVYEKIDGCGTFTPVAFELIKNDPNLGPAPTGFQFLKVNVNGRYKAGVMVEYRVEIVGDYLVSLQPISVKAATDILVFDCGCFEVPQCTPEGKLSLTKECSHTISNNIAILQYHLVASNIGETELTDVQITDTITIPNNAILGEVRVTPDNLSVTTSTNQVTISGSLGNIPVGGSVPIDYTIEVLGFTAPGTFTFSNTAMVSSVSSQAFAMCSTSIDVVELQTNKCCFIDGNTVTYHMSLTSVGGSPNSTVDVRDRLLIPAGLTVSFSSFGECLATFENTTTQVPLNTNITGPQIISILCENITVPRNGSIHNNIIFTLVSSSRIGESTIQNAVISVEPTNSTNQIFLGAGELPVLANVNVNLSLSCSNPCA